MKTTFFATTAALLALGLSGCASVMGDVRPFAPVGQQAMAMPAQAYPGMVPVNAAGQPVMVAPQMVQVAAPGVAQPVAQQVTYVPAPYAAAPAAATNNAGSIYAGNSPAAGGGLHLFRDNKARDVGDLLTIELVENTSSRSVAKTSITKDQGVGLSAPVLGGMPVTYNGKSILQAEVEGSRDFSGAGNTAQSNQLDGDITVTVVQVLGNGNLLVSGQKRMRLNQGDELVQVQGIVRTADISPENRITSDRVGNAQIVYGGSGTMARSNAMGWLGRFFNSAAFPY